MHVHGLAIIDKHGDITSLLCNQISFKVRPSFTFRRFVTTENNCLHIILWTSVMHHISVKGWCDLKAYQSSCKGQQRKSYTLNGHLSKPIANLLFAWTRTTRLRVVCILKTETSQNQEPTTANRTDEQTDLVGHTTIRRLRIPELLQYRSNSKPKQVEEAKIIF